MMLNFIFWI